MKTLSNIKIGNITLLSVLKSLTVVSLSTYIINCIFFGFFAISSFIIFLITVALFLICTHKPKHNPKMFSQQQLNKHHANWNIINNRLKEISVIILFFISFNLSAQVAPKDDNKVLKDTTIQNKVYKLYLGKKGGRYIWKYSENKKEFRKRYFSNKNKK